MGKVKTLRQDVYKKIAAGEVVERPLSVVKELVENALDAGADNIKVEINEGGKQLIRVTDNGSGFAPEDILTAFQNHSTSKISELSDFDTLSTLGFRGEALPSILEVSKITLKTANNTEGRGVLCIFSEGRLQQKDDIAFSQGTFIEVKDLFYNFPVRKKFLKTERTEYNQIISFLEPVSLVHFDKSLELVHNGKTVFLYEKTNSLKDRIYQVFGKDYLDSLQEVNFGEDNYGVNGFISRLNTGVSTKKHQFFFVNSRPIREKTLIASLNNTFEKYLEKSRNPAAVLMLKIPPQEVDVNIHPMKLEIKFENANAIYKLIKHTIESTLGMANGAGISGGMDFTTGPMPGSSIGFNRPATSNDSWRGGGSQQQNWSSSFPASNRNFNRTSISMEGQKPIPQTDYEQAQLYTGGFMDEEDFFIIGQYKNSYILVEKNTDLLLIDQHNAQERVNFDQLKKEYQEDQVVSMSPLFPVIIELTPSEAQALEGQKMDLLTRLGFRLESLGGNTFDIKSFPQILGEKNLKEAIRTVIHLDITSKEDETAFEDQILAEVACKSAIKVNHKLYPDQMKTIVKNLFKTSNPYFCPHKRPIIVEFTLEQIEKMLKRK